MSKAKDVTLNNSSSQTLTFKLTWKDGGIEQRVMDRSTARADLRGITDNSEVTVETKVGNNPISVKFTYKTTAQHGELTVYADGTYSWNER